MHRSLSLLLPLLAAPLSLACSSSSSSPPLDAGADGSSGSSSGGGDAGPDVIVDPDNCVKPGTPNNAQGVGGYCSPGGGQCAHGGPDGGTLCTADVGSLVPAHAWFCTDVCSPDAGAVVCGNPGPPCVSTPEGYPVCLPAACKSFLGDAGGD